MVERAVHAVAADGGPAFLAALEAALDGSGPALLPLSPGADWSATVAALRPTHVSGRPNPPGAGVDPSTAVIIATSGSTGQPKGVELAAEALLASATASLRRLAAGPGERWLCCLPMSHVAGLQVLVRSLVGGTSPVVQTRFDPARGDARFVSLVPTQLRRALDRSLNVSAFRAILLGGGAIHPDLLSAARAAGARVVTTYGMSETSGGCVYDRTPLDGVRVDVRADGRIRIGGPVLFSRYRLRPDLTAEALRDGWFHTSDLGSMDGGRLRVLGRVDDVINTGGEKVVAGVVARVLDEHPRVREAVVVGRADPEWGERVTAVVVPVDPAHPPTLEALRSFVQARLPTYAAPRELEIVPAIPLLRSGKPDLLALSGEIRNAGES